MSWTSLYIVVELIIICLNYSYTAFNFWHEGLNLLGRESVKKTATMLKKKKNKKFWYLSEVMFTRAHKFYHCLIQITLIIVFFPLFYWLPSRGCSFGQFGYQFLSPQIEWIIESSNLGKSVKPCEAHDTKTTQVDTTGRQLWGKNCPRFKESRSHISRV